jgi:triacylglycerol lipase
MPALPPPYSYSASFDKSRAIELAALTDAAYQQLADFQNHRLWTVPGPYTVTPKTYQVTPADPLPQAKTYQIEAQFYAVETWGLPTLLPKSPVPFGFVATNGNDTYVAIRGTQTPLEWLDDFTVGLVPFFPDPANLSVAWGNTTKGFLGLYNQVIPAITAALQNLQAAGRDLSSLFVTGHSLGAALAHLTAAGIKEKLGRLAPISYTFAGPRTGDPAFAQAYEGADLQTWRIFNTEDIAPTVPISTNQLGNTSQTSIFLNLLIRGLPAGFSHIGYPVAVTFDQGKVDDNHNLDNLWATM